MERMISSAEPFLSSRSSIRRSIEVIATYVIAECRGVTGRVRGVQAGSTGRSKLCPRRHASAGNSSRLRHPPRLLDMPPVVRHHQAPAVEHAVGDDPDEGRRHDRAGGALVVERRHPRHRIAVLLDEALDDVGGDVAGRRPRRSRCLELPRRLRRLRPNHDSPDRRPGRIGSRCHTVRGRAGLRASSAALSIRRFAVSRCSKHCATLQRAASGRQFNCRAFSPPNVASASRAMSPSPVLTSASDRVV